MLLRNLDVYGGYLNLYFKNYSRVKTKLGGIITIISTMIIAVLSWCTAKDIYYKKGPIYFKDKIRHDYAQEVSVNTEEFPLSFFTSNLSGTTLYDEKLFDFKIYYIQYNNILTDEYANVKSQELKLRFCQPSDYPNFTKEEFKIKNLHLHKCLIDKNINLYGSPYENSFGFIQAEFSICTNNTISNYYCYDGLEISNVIRNQEINFSFAYSDYNINILDNKNTLETHLRYYKMHASLRMKKKFELSLEQNYINTDNGLIFEDRSQLKFIKTVEAFNDFSNYDYNERVLINLSISAASTSNIYYRKYIKLPEILAYVGGLINIFYVIFFNIYIPYNQFIRNTTILNTLFDLSRENPNQTDSDRNYFSNYKKFTGLRDNSISLKLPNFSSNTIESDQVIDNIKENIIKRDNIKSNMSFKELLFSNCRFISKRNLNLDIYFKAQIEIQKHLDILNIIKKMFEVDNLKKVLLTENQRLLFENNLIKLSHNDDTLKIPEFNSVNTYLDNLKNRVSYDEIDKKLLKLYL